MFYPMALVSSLHNYSCGNGIDAKITLQISKIQQPPIFAQKLQISIKSDFPNRFFNFLQECVQKGEYFGAYRVPIHEHFFFKVFPCSQMASMPWNRESSVKPSSLKVKSTIFGIQLAWLKHLI